MSDVELSYLSATEAAALIRDGSLSPVALVTNALERIEEVNPKLNCFCFTYPSEAIEQAREAERAIAAGDELGPLHGVPIAIKDLTPTKKSLNNPMFAVSRGRGGLDVKLDDIADRPGAALVTGYGANRRYPRRSASFPAVPPAAGRLLPCHPVA